MKRYLLSGILMVLLVSACSQAVTPAPPEEESTKPVVNLFRPPT